MKYLFLVLLLISAPAFAKYPNAHDPKCGPLTDTPEQRAARVDPTPDKHCNDWSNPGSIEPPPHWNPTGNPESSASKPVYGDPRPTLVTPPK